MKITLLCVGKVKEAFYRDLIAMHMKTLQKKCEFTICQIDDLPIQKKAGERLFSQIKEEEGRQLLRRIPKGAYVIALCIEGKEMVPAAHQSLLRQIREDGYTQLVYIIGGSLGLSDAVVSRADCRLSFSSMTFPHQLMRVMLLEVLQRDYL